jgi:hypothetical protein
MLGRETTDGPSTAPPGARATFRDLAADALRHWESRRLVYNAALALVVLGHFMANWPASRSLLRRDALLGFFLLAVLANICYCAVYAVDLFVQFSGVRGVWPKWRWLVLGTGTAFAAVIAHFITMGFFRSGPD